MAKNKINILFIIDNFFGIGGTERHLTYLASMLDKDKYQCNIVSFNVTERYMEEVSKLGLKVYHLKIEKILSVDIFINAIKLYKFIKKEKVDIVQTYHFMSDTFGVLVSRLAGIKNIISSRRDMGFMKGKNKLIIIRFMNKYIKKFIVVSDAVGAWITANENVSKSKQVKIYNGIDLSKYNIPSISEWTNIRLRLGLSVNDFVIGIVGHFRPEKGHDLFFQAASDLYNKGPDIKFVCVGAGPLAEQYRNLAREKGFEDSIIFTGYISDPKELISIFDVACLTSKTEGFSNAILEYMALGKPVVATAVGGNCEVVVDGWNGYLISPDSPDQLSEKLHILYTNPELRGKMSEQCRKTVEKKYGIENMIKAHCALYKEVVGY